MSIARLARVPFAALLLAVAWTGVAVAQQQGAPQQTGELLQELQQIQQRLEQIEQQALQEDPELQERRETVVGMVEDAMIEMNPELETKIDRLEALEGEFVEAQSEGDQEKVQALAMEAQQLQGEVQQAQSQAMERDDVAAELDGFRDQLLARMQEIEPETGQLIERMNVIGQQLSGGSGSGD